MTWKQTWKAVAESIVSAKRSIAISGTATVTLTVAKLDRMADNLIYSTSRQRVPFIYVDPEAPTVEEKAQHALLVLGYLGRERVVKGGRDKKAALANQEFAQAGEIEGVDWD